MKKVTLYFKSGNSLTFKCNAYKFKIDRHTNEYVGYELDSPQPKVSFVPGELECYTSEDCK